MVLDRGAAVWQPADVPQRDSPSTFVDVVTTRTLTDDEPIGNQCK